MRKSLALFFLFSLCGCGGNLKYLSTSQRHSFLPGKRNIDVFVISTHRMNMAKSKYVFAEGIDIRYCSNMLTPWDKFNVGLTEFFSLLILQPAVLKSVDTEPHIDSNVRFNELQQALGNEYILTNKTNEFDSEKHFINREKKSGNLFLVYHTCDLEAVPAKNDYFDDRYCYVSVANVRVFLYDGHSKILDYREAFIPKCLSMVSEYTLVYESSETVNARLIDNVRKQISFVLQK